MPPASHSRGRAAELSVGLELARAALDVALLPPRSLAYLARRASLVEELRADLARDAPLSDLAAPSQTPPAATGRPRKLFLACAEASGEIHAVGLARELRAELARRGEPEPVLTGLGGSELQRAGIALVGRPVERAAMGFDGMLSSLPYYLALLRDVARSLERERPDVVIAVDSPALFVPLGHLARARGVHMVHFVSPQYWGWAPWRARGYRSAVDLALSILPFEKAWYERRGIRCRYVGHPLLDALPDDVPAPEDPRRVALAVLGGSRSGILKRNLPWMLARVARLRETRPELEVIVPNDRRELEYEVRSIVRASGAEDWAQVEIGDLHASLARARAAFSVSGTVLVDVAHHRVPAVVLYRVKRRLAVWLSRHFLTTPWFALPNLLAGREVCPEYCFAGEGPVEEIEAALARALEDESWRLSARAGLARAWERLGTPGALGRVARAALDEAARGGAA